jgi:hypothetical protein
MSTFDVRSRRRQSKLSNPHAIVQLLLKPCYDALFFATTVESPVALSTGGRNYRPARGCIHGGRSLQIGRRVGSPKITACLRYEHVLRSCERHGYFEEIGTVLVLSARLE